MSVRVKFVTHSCVFETHSCVLVTHSYNSPFFCALSHLCSTLRMLVRVEFVTHSHVSVTHSYNPPSCVLSHIYAAHSECQITWSSWLIHVSHLWSTNRMSLRVEFVTHSCVFVTPSRVLATHWLIHTSRLFLCSLTPVDHTHTVSPRRVCHSFTCVEDSFMCVRDSCIPLSFLFFLIPAEHSHTVRAQRVRMWSSWIIYMCSCLIHTCHFRSLSIVCDSIYLFTCVRDSFIYVSLGAQFLQLLISVDNSFVP